MDKVHENHNYRKNIKAFWKFVNGSAKSSKNRIESLIEANDNSFCHEGKVKIFKIHYRKLGSE